MATPKSMDPHSRRSRKRKNRGFVSLEASGRKHRRALGRLQTRCVFDGKPHAPGDKAPCSLSGGRLKAWMFVGPGCMKYY